MAAGQPGAACREVRGQSNTWRKEGTPHGVPTCLARRGARWPWAPCSAVPGSRLGALFPSPQPLRATSSITAINITVHQDRLQQNPNKENHQPGHKVIHKKTEFVTASGSCLPRG